MVTSLQKWGNSHGVRIPSAFMKTLGWNRDDKLVIEMNREAVVLRRSSERRRVVLRDLFRDFEDGTQAQSTAGSVGQILEFQKPFFFDADCSSKTAVIVGSGVLYEKTGLLVLCPIVKKSEPYPLHIALDERSRTQGVILCEYLRSARLTEGTYRVVEALPEDLLCRAQDLTSAEIDGSERSG